ncbi:MAG: glycosyltransferase family 4 protein [Verrucomicrobiaceae bacterium]|nr:glycosyltransferase family 4 protein [Verrucomicrobiaceae bacterium]
MKWLALTFGGASTLYRVEQYVSLLRDLGIELVCRPAEELSAISGFAEYDGIFLQKKLLSWSNRRRIAQSGLPVIFDIDDATWHPLEKEHHFLTRWRTQRRLTASLKLSQLALPANEYLAAHLRKDHPRVEVLPMTMPLADWPPMAEKSGPVVLGWAGAPGNHFQLRSIDAALAQVKAAMPEVTVCIFSGVRPEMRTAIEFVPFDLKKQTEVLHSFSIGLLPLPDTAFNHGKSPIKALQYMAAGIPCVASALAGTVEMIGEQNGGALHAANEAEWTHNLLQLARDAALRQKMGQQARERFEAHFTAEATAHKLAVYMRELAKSTSR